MLEPVDRDLVITERAALIGWRLREGEMFTTRHVADMLGIQPSGAYKLMLKLCRVLPISHIGGYWVYPMSKLDIPVCYSDEDV